MARQSIIFILISLTGYFNCLCQEDVTIKININDLIKGQIYKISNNRFGGNIKLGRKTRSIGEIYINQQLPGSYFNATHNQVFDIYNFSNHSWSPVTIEHDSRIYLDSLGTRRYAHLAGVNFFYKNNNIHFFAGPEFDMYDFLDIDAVGVGFRLIIRFRRVLPKDGEIIF